eukprot:3108835-Amphidinium_carterae.1
MCPYLEWAGWHSPQQAEQKEFMKPAVVPALMRETPLPHGCPKVYIYRDLPKNWTFRDAHQLTPKDVFGKDALKASGPTWAKHPAIRAVQQHDTIRSLYVRLLRGPRCYTEDPERADLFLIPIFVVDNVRKEDQLTQWAAEKCRGTADELVAALKHLTWETAHKHIIGIGRMSMYWFLDTCLP